MLRVGRRGILERVARPSQSSASGGARTKGPSKKRLRNHTGPPELSRDAARGGQGWTQQAAFGPCPQATPRGERPKGRDGRSQTTERAETPGRQGVDPRIQTRSAQTPPRRQPRRAVPSSERSTTAVRQARVVRRPRSLLSSNPPGAKADTQGYRLEAPTPRDPSVRLAAGVQGPRRAVPSSERSTTAVRQARVTRRPRDDAPQTQSRESVGRVIPTTITRDITTEARAGKGAQALRLRACR